MFPKVKRTVCKKSNYPHKPQITFQKLYSSQSFLCRQQTKENESASEQLKTREWKPTKSPAFSHPSPPSSTIFEQVKDLGKPELSPESLASVTIYVTDVNDCAPIFDYTDYNVTLYLPTYENVVIEQVKANDPDSSENSTLRYDIIEGNSAGVFAIDSTTGIITTR